MSVTTLAPPVVASSAVVPTSSTPSVSPALDLTVVTVELLVARDISAFSQRRVARRGYHGLTGTDPAITGEPPEEQVRRTLDAS